MLTSAPHSSPSLLGEGDRRRRRWWRRFELLPLLVRGGGRGVVLAAPAALLAMLTACTQTPARPLGHQVRTIVSLNPCSDAILAEVTAPGQLLAISHYSADPRSRSMDAAKARQYPVTGGTLEEVIALRPDVVVDGTFVAPATAASYHRLGFALQRHCLVCHTAYPFFVVKSCRNRLMRSRSAGENSASACFTAPIRASGSRGNVTIEISHRSIFSSFRVRVALSVWELTVLNPIESPFTARCLSSANNSRPRCTSRFSAPRQNSPR